MIIGIDHGNAQIKTRNTCFVSGVEEFPTKPPMAADVIRAGTGRSLASGCPLCGTRPRTTVSIC